ncbi:MAG: FadR family transcriptional regulator [Actinobacteria bacterium]|nr:FadR family transcriptional regulator [Actinomycetota bacterium]
MAFQPLPDAVLRPLSDSSAFATTAERLGAVIRLGVFGFGEQLPPERELAVRLGVSRVNLREAIAVLREAGMVRTRRGRGGGTTVLYAGHPAGPPDADELRERGPQIRDALDFRRVVEPGAAHLAASRQLDADQRDWLTGCLAGYEEQADTAGAGPDHRIADSRLHLAVATLTGSPMLVEAVIRVQASLDSPLSRLPAGVEECRQAHRGVVAAILAGDPLAARAEMERLCDRTAGQLRALLA